MLEKEYDFVAKGKGLQFCPSCKAKIEKATVCGHMFCKKCLFSFCIFCRKRYSPNHLNPFNVLGCQSIHNRKFNIASLILILQMEKS